MAPDLLIILVILLIVAVIALLIWVIILRARLAGPDSAEMSAPVSRKRVSPLVVPPAEAQAAALQGIIDAGLLNRSEWLTRLTHSPVPLTPFLVRRLDVVDPAFAYYYLVPFGKDDSSVSAVAMVDGISTEFLECSPMKSSPDRSWGQLAAEWRTVESTYRQLQRGGVKPLDVRMEDTFIWTPCVESQSQNYPFRMAVVDGKTLYIRIDGKVFNQLTPLLPGGGTPPTI